MFSKRDGSYESLCGGINNEGEEALYDVLEVVLELNGQWEELWFGRAAA